MHVPLIIITLTTGSLLGTYAGNFQTQYEWKYFDYVWPSAAKKSEAIRTGAYNHSMIMPIDVDVAQDGRVFVTLLQLPGVPARMGYVSTQKSPSGPLIQPYPNWEWFGNGDCDNSIEKVLRVEIDKCNRLWVLDTGSKKNPKRNCSAKLLAFDLNTDTLISRVNFPDDIARNPRTIESLMATTVVETYGQNCEDTTKIVARDPKRLQYATGMKVLSRPFLQEEELWVITNRFPAFSQGHLNFKESNYFILRSTVRDLIAGTRCELPLGITDYGITKLKAIY
ncbi:hypothetical protein QAD02_012438 [Eretmocerus hayati]|uniref:Uncharacterized protein n=1 Tax=Eretmocerus hayati TaxID=131215 RepID=A0ACC2P0Q1_9HYME|nr:hypothetical protein QAD02_012438 [Eretmocerus hayati]